MKFSVETSSKVWLTTVATASLLISDAAMAATMEKGNLNLKGALEPIHKVTLGGALDLYSSLTLKSRRRNEGYISARKLKIDSKGDIDSVMARVENVINRDYDLEVGPLSEEGVAALSRALESPTCKTASLRIQGDVSGRSAMAMAKALGSPHNKVTTLSLSDIKAGDEWAKAVAKALESPYCKLTELTFRRAT